MSIKPACPVCGSNSVLLQGRPQKDRRIGLHGKWQFIECNNCCAAFQYPLPSYAELGNFYENYSQEKFVDLSQGAGARFPGIRKLLHTLTGDIDPRDFIPVSAGIKVLDYGCGHAGYLSYFDAIGIDISGAEVSQYIVDDCVKSGLNVRLIGDFSRIPFEDSTFNIVYLMQVFEHLRDPNQFMQELSRVLREGGTAYIAVPNYESIWRKIFQDNWVSGWFAPFHLYQYSLKTFEILSEKNGFEVVDSWTNTPESWFRLNCKAAFLSKESHLDSRSSWVDLMPVRLMSSLLLRLVEFFVKERDCLVVVLKKSPELVQHD